MLCYVNSYAFKVFMQNRCDAASSSRDLVHRSTLHDVQTFLIYFSSCSLCYERSTSCIKCFICCMYPSVGRIRVC